MAAAPALASSALLLLAAACQRAAPSGEGADVVELRQQVAELKRQLEARDAKPASPATQQQRDELIKNYGLESAIVEAKVLSVKSRIGGVNLHIDLTNRSSGLLALVCVNINLYNKAGAFLCSDSPCGYNVRPGQTATAPGHCESVRKDEVSTWRLSLGRVKLQRESGDAVSVATIFQLKEVR
ncbi:MAG: hypothetical protein IT381_10405 [Deltaproteobacteria bacterium]|nr:hypothetical protein [Deltaproteobacteria bacterium]